MIDEELGLIYYLDDLEADDEDDDRESDDSWDGFHIEFAPTEDDDELDWEGIEFDDSGVEVETEQDGY